MFGYAEKEKVPPVHKPSNRRPARPAQSSATASYSGPIEYRTSKSLFGEEVKLRHVISQPKITLYGEFITLPEDFPVRLIQIIEQAAKKHSVLITDDQSAKLQTNLSDTFAPTPGQNTNTLEFLSVLFEQMANANILLSSDFIEEIKKGCKFYAEPLCESSATDSVKEFLLQWSNFNSDSSMGGINPTDYQYENIDAVMPLLDIDKVSKTDSSEAENVEAEKRRLEAATLIHGQLEEKDLTADQLREILLKLNEIYSPQTIKPYKQGFRYHSVQIGQGDSAIGTTPAIEVEKSVGQVINKIVANLAPCESQLKDSKKLSDEMLKTVIATSAMAYQLLISIHPFSDGNGRTCRMFANYILMRYGLLPATFSEDSAKQSMYDDTPPKESNTNEPSKLNTPTGAYMAMIKALATSLDELHSRSSSQTQETEETP